VHRTGLKILDDGVAKEHGFNKNSTLNLWRYTMLTKTKIALVAALVAGSASVASAQGFDPNPANRYPMYGTPAGKAMPYLGLAAQSVAPSGTDSQNANPRGLVSRNVSAQRTLRSAPVALRSAPVALRSAPVALRSAPVALRQGNTARSVGQAPAYQAPAYYGSQQQDGFDVDRFDRASSPYAGGVN
jgi:hypothetical protein